MSELTSRERMRRILKREPVDRIGLHESFWSETVPKWKREGHLKPDEDIYEHFPFDLRVIWPFKFAAKLDWENEIIEETDETITIKDANGAIMRTFKNRSGVPEHIDFTVKNRAGWEEHIKPYLTNEKDFRRRIDFQAYRDMKKYCDERNLFFCWSGVSVFESMHPICGHEYMLLGMAEDPEWIKDMADTIADVQINLFEILFAEEGLPDGVFYAEDMGFKHRPFMSPAMYKELIFPAHKRLFDYAHANGLLVILHSCGYVEPLVPGLIEAGIDCLQAMEVKAGMDIIKLKKNFGDKIAFMGGIDIRVLETNDNSKVEEELMKKVPIAMEGSGYCLHTDHSVPQSVEYETYKFFVERGLEIGTYQ